MRFAAVAALVGVAAANYDAYPVEAVTTSPSGKTVYQTDYVTITSCGPEVPNCPASSTVTYSSTYAVSTSTTAAVPVYPTGEEEYPDYPVETPSSAPVVSSSTKPAQGYPTYPAGSSGTVSKPAQTYPVVSVSTKAETSPVYPTGGVSTSVVTYSTCVPTVSYSTVTIYPSGSATKPATQPGAPHPTGGYPTGGYPTHSAPPSYPTVPVAGAPKMAGSVVLAAAAGVAALFL